MSNTISTILRLKSLLIMITSFTLISSADAQSTNVGTWNVCDLIYKLNKHYTLWTEVQTRTQDLYSAFYYHELKCGAFYNFPKSRSSVFLGGGRYTTYNYSGNFKSPVSSEEFRIWEQFVLNNGYNHLNIEHRYRLEQRWINNNFKPRLRYRINPTFAINHSSIVPKTLFVSAFDEIFIGNANPHLERNRYYIGIGYQFSNSFAFQSGYINQTDFNALGGQKDKRFIQSTLVFYLDKKTAIKEGKTNTIVD